MAKPKVREGQCEPGVQDCEPIPESQLRPDGLDDDCDGMIDCVQCIHTCSADATGVQNCSADDDLMLDEFRPYEVDDDSSDEELPN